MKETSLLFYQEPTVLDVNLHRKLRLRPSSHSFAASTNSVMVAAIEFQHAGHDYPIFFVKGRDNEFLAVALLGLRSDQNLFVDDNGNWLPGLYVPAFVRRYPFVPGAAEDGSLVACFDAQSPAVQEEEGEQLFAADDTPSPLLKQALGLLEAFAGDCKNTQVFIKRLEALNLLKEVNLNGNLATGEVIAMQGLWAIDEEVLAKLPPEVVQEFFAAGYLAAINAHQMSLLSCRNLVNLAGKGAEQSSADARTVDGSDNDDDTGLAEIKVVRKAARPKFNA